jgi:hypothetical protein
MIKNYRHFPIFYSLYFYFLSCPSFSYAQYKLEIVRNFAVESLYPVEIVDYFSKDGLYLGYINSVEGKRIVLIDEKGDIIKNKILEGDGPDKSSAPFNAMSFAENGTIYLQSFSFIYRYDQNLNLIERFSYPSSTSFRIYGRMEFFSYFHLEGSKSNFSFITNPSETNSFRPGNEDTDELIEIFQKGTNKPYKIAPVSDRLMFSKFDRSLFADLFFIIYKLDPKTRKLYLTTKTDSEIIVYNLINKNLETRIMINHGEFKILQKSRISRNDFITNGRVALGAKNHKLHSLGGGKIILDYVKEIPPETYQKKIAEDPTYHHFQDPNYHRLILFEDTKQLTGDIKLPANGKLMATLPDNKLLFQLIDPTKEEDYIRFGVYVLVKSGN